MSSLVFMKILESSSERYDAGIKILTLGKITRVYDRLTEGIAAGENVLDIGCGTGEVSIRSARKGAMVTAMDISPEMLDRAREKIEAEKLTPNIEIKEMGVAELESLPDHGYDRILSSLCFSELSREEMIFTLRQCFRLLKKDGILSIADETVPSNIFSWVLSKIIRLPLVIVTWLISQQTTHALRDLEKDLAENGFENLETRRSFTGSFAEFTCRKKEAP